MKYASSVEKWGMYEIELEGPSDGNPFCDQWIRGTFTCKNESKTVDGFYDGNGIYKVRFMPSFEETYTLLEPGGIDHSESGRNNQSELIRNSQCTCLAN